MRRYLTGLLCCGGAVVYLLFYTLEKNRGASRRLRGASRPRALIGNATTMAQYKGGVLYAMRKTMWNCLGQWARSQDVEDYDLTVNVGLDGRYCVRAGGRANQTRA